MISKQLRKKYLNFIHAYEVLIVLLCLLIILRIPSLFEPYWYGDEGIYLTLGIAMKQGAKLYAQIVDHKTPLIYYLAMTPSQFWFRMLTLVAISIATTAFYFVAGKIVTYKKQIIATLLFICFTSIPWLEGNVPNGEHFVMTFILIGAWFLSNSSFFKKSLHITKSPNLFKDKQNFVLFLAGIFFGLAILTKVPALFDVVAFASIGLFFLFKDFHVLKFLSGLKNKKMVVITKIVQKLPFVFFNWIILGIGIITPIVLSIVYYILQGSGKAYLQFGLLYNFRYTNTWGLPFSNSVLIFLFSMPGKIMLVGMFFIVLIALSHKLSQKTQFIIFWTVLALFAALLSSRPYPHYFLQLVPPFSLLVVTLFSKKIYKFSISIFMLLLIVVSLILLQFKPYPTFAYYKNFFSYITNKKTKIEYFMYFDRFMKDNYAIAQVLRKDKQEKIFIWGTNAMLYALSRKAPVGRFTVSFHIKDMNAYKETYHDLVAYEPTYIIVMKDEHGDFNKFYSYLSTYYAPYVEAEHMILYKRIPQFSFK